MRLYNKNVSSNSDSSEICMSLKMLAEVMDQNKTYQAVEQNVN